MKKATKDHRYIVVIVFGAHETSAETFRTRKEALESYEHWRKTGAGLELYIGKLFDTKPRER